MMEAAAPCETGCIPCGLGCNPVRLRLQPLCMQARIGAHGDDAGAAEALRLCSGEDQADAEWRVAAAGAVGDEE